MRTNDESDFADDDFGIVRRPPSRQSGLGKTIVGYLLAVGGLVFGGQWTALTYFFAGIKLATLLSAGASLLLVVAGILLIVAGNRSTRQVVAAGSTLVLVALLLVSGSAAAYVFGFAVCLSGN